MSDHGYYGPGTVSWRLYRERVMLLGGPRALVLQLAHPLVAAGVGDHSNFREDPISRLTRTLDATLGIVFGTRADADRAARGIDAVHGRVRGTLPEDAGRFPAGTPYDARDPELGLWVHATLIETTLTLYPLVVGPITPDEAERAWQESKVAARALGVGDDHLPSDLHAFREYFDGMIRSDALAAAPFQRELIDDVLYPNIRGVPRRAWAPGAALTIGLLPGPVRELFGYELSGWERRVASLAPRLVRGVLPVLPHALRWMPHARRAYGRAGAAA